LVGSPSSGRKKGHNPLGGPIGPHGPHRPTGRLDHLGQMPGKEFLRIEIEFCIFAKALENCTYLDMGNFPKFF
jgi:hypothetical protein